MFPRISSIWSVSLWLTSIMLVVFGGLSQATGPELLPDAERIRTLHEARHQALNAHDLDEYTLYLADDVVLEFVDVFPPVNGKESVRSFIETLFGAFPDFHVTETRLLIAEDIAVAEHIVTATHQGEWLGIPATGRRIQAPHIDVVEYEGDKVKRAATYMDMASVMMQLGVMPTPEQRPTSPSFTLPDAVPTGLAPTEAITEVQARWNAHDLVGNAEMHPPDGELFIAAFGVPMGREAFIASQEMYFHAFPDARVDPIRLVDLGDGWVINEVVYTATQDGPYSGIPATGLPIKVRAALLYQIGTDGLIQLMHAYFNNTTVLTQIGAIPSTEPGDFSHVFFLSLEPGLNMVSLPLKPSIPYTARSLAEQLSATVVIELDGPRQRFVGFTRDAPGDGFDIKGGQGYIVNVPEARTVAFTGAAWANQPPVAAPPSISSGSAWAFVVNTTADDATHIQVENQSTGRLLAMVPDGNGRYSGVWADLTQQAVIHAGDVLELTVRDETGVLGKHTHSVGQEDIQRAFVTVPLGINSMRPASSMLYQNYPNPFNPETWLPYTLSTDATVTIRIYSLQGQLVRQLDLGHRSAGYYLDRDAAAYWDGRNNVGQQVASGTYYYQLQAGEFTTTRRMVIMK